VNDRCKLEAQRRQAAIMEIVLVRRGQERGRRKKDVNRARTHQEEKCEPSCEYLESNEYRSGDVGSDER
jgi:hypothetical protein